MIAGIGIDIVEIKRIINIANIDVEKCKIFTPKEHAYCRNKVEPYKHYAARWAAKEAFYKAWGEDIPKANIEVIHDVDGQPRFRFHNISRPANSQAQLSLSHDGAYAIAYVIIET